MGRRRFGIRLAKRLGLRYPPEFSARYNIAPTQQVPIVRFTTAGERELSQVQWGLVPFWAKDPTIGSNMINARAETVFRNPSVRDAYKKTRCLIPATGFYEWPKVRTGQSSQCTSA